MRRGLMLAALLVAAPAFAQEMGGMAMPAPAPSPDAPAPATPAMGAMPGMTAPMTGMMGRYPMTRESSGTAWQPDSAPMRAAMFDAGGWSLMAEAFVTGIYDHQGGARGDSEAFSTSMAMLMAARDVSPADRIGLRAMASLDPLMGPQGYPLLFAVGETADGRTLLVDRQHPHDLVMELAGSWTHDLGGGRALSVYAGLPGEPALGPPAFMHRVSGMDDPEAPIGHHWFDSTHITYGVVTAAFEAGEVKLEASAFRGREPDQYRWDIEAPALDSWSVRVWWNPSANLSMQLSTGHLHSPEQLEPGQDEQRTTASATYNLPLGAGRRWATTLAWSDKDERPGPALTGLLAETALTLGRDEVYARAEHEAEDELFQTGPLAGHIFEVSKLSVGAQHELPVARHLFLAAGVLASGYAYPGALRASYGGQGIKSAMVYGRLRFGS